MKKRIALSAVAALAGGLLVAAPASAAAGDYFASLASTATTADKLIGYSAGDIATLTITMTAKSGETLDGSTAPQGLTVTATGAAATAGKIAFNTTDLTTANTTGNATVAGFNANAADNTFTVAPTADVNGGLTTAVAKVNVRLLAGAVAADSGDITFTVTDTGANAAMFAAGDNVKVITLTVGDIVGQTNTLSASSATVAAGASTTFTVTDAFTANPSKTNTLAVTAPAGITQSVAVGTATGGSAGVTATTATSTTVTNIKNALAGAYTVTHTVTLTASASASGSYSITAGTKTFTLTVNPAQGAYSLTTVATAAAGTGAYEASGDKVLYAPKTATNAAVGTLTITETDSLGNAVTLANSKSALVTLSGVGSLAGIVSTTSPVSTQYVVVSAADMVGGEVVSVFADGRAGEGIVSVTIDGVVVKTQTVKFYGNAAKLTTTALQTVAAEAGVTATGSLVNVGGVASATNDPAIAILATDANGVPVPVTVTAVSSNPLVLSSTITQFRDNGVGLYTAGTFMNHISYTSVANAVSGNTATLTFSVTNADGTKVSTDAIAITIGGKVKTVALTLDKAAYTTGEAAVVTVSAKDAAGNAAYDGQTPLGAALVSNLVTGGAALPGALDAIVGGKVAVKVYAPSVAGTWTIAGKDENGVALSATATVAAPLDANITALTAKAASTEATVAALQVTVASVIKSLKVQWWLLKKIAVKVGIKLG